MGVEDSVLSIEVITVHTQKNKYLSWREMETRSIAISKSTGLSYTPSLNVLIIMWEIKPRLKLLETYYIGRPFGSGEFGQVYEGCLFADGLPIAIKEIKSETVPKWTYWLQASCHGKKKFGICTVPLEIEMSIRASKVEGVLKILGVCKNPKTNIFYLVLD